MQKIKTFFRTFVLSCTSPKYYAEVLKARFGFSLKYFLFLQFITSFAIASLILIPLSAFNLSGLLESAEQAYPSNLAVQVEDGKLSINQPLPYKIALPGEFYEDESMNSEEMYGPEVQNLVVFDTDESITGATDVFAQDSLAVLTETTIYVRDDSRGGLRVYPIPTGESFRIDQAMVDEFFTKVANHPFVKNKLYIPLIAGIFLLFVFPMMVLGGLIVAAIYGFFVWLMGKVLAAPVLAGSVLSYTKSVQVTLHSMTLITVVQTVLRIVGQGYQLEGFWYFVAFMAWTGFVLHQAHHQTPGSPSTTTPVAVAAPKTVAKAKPLKKPAKKGKK